MPGLELLQPIKIKDYSPPTYALTITGHGNMETGRQATNKGLAVLGSAAGYQPTKSKTQTIS